MRCVNRRLQTILLAAAVATAAAGCATFDTETLARVGDAELSQDQLDELVELLPAAATPQGAEPLPGDVNDVDDVRQSMRIWIQTQVQADQIEERGLTISADAIDENTALLSGAGGLPGFTEASDQTRDLLVSFLAGGAVLAAPASEATPGLIDFYRRGVEASGIICTSHILVEDQATADELSAQLADGADFAELAAANSIDPGSGPLGGDLGCQRVQDFSAQLIPVFVNAALAATTDEPTEPVQSDFGYHIILVRGADTAGPSLAALESDPIIALLRADISVDPRYGEFDAATGQVVPLGS